MFAYYHTIVTFAVKEVVCDALTMERGNNNKRIILIIIAVLLLNCSCSKNTLKNKNAELVYDYIESDTVKKCFFQVLKIQNHYNETKNKVFKQNEKILEYSECVTENGIYRYCADSMYKSHSFNEVEYIENCLPLNPPFLNKKVKLFEKKSYEINTKKVEIISFEEINSVHDEIVTYYIKGLGFICYCDLEKMSCLILSDYKGISFDKGIYSEIKDKLINDTLYFALERIKRFQPPSPPK